MTLSVFLNFENCTENVKLTIRVWGKIHSACYILHFHETWIKIWFWKHNYMGISLCKVSSLQKHLIILLCWNILREIYWYNICSKIYCFFSSQIRALGIVTLGSIQNIFEYFDGIWLLRGGSKILPDKIWNILDKMFRQ